MVQNLKNKHAHEREREREREREHTCAVVPPDPGRLYGPHPAEWAILPGPRTQTPHRPP